LIKLLSTNKLNAIFFAVVLVAGTFALMSPSFMFKGVQAEPGYDKPKYTSYKSDYNYKSKDTIGIKKVNCNNVNLNVNDAAVNNVARPPVGDFTTLDTSESGEEEGITTANSFAGNGERSINNNGFKKDKDGFVYVCINNNNNKVSAEEQTSSLTVYKEVFGCDIINQEDDGTMNCKDLPNNSPLWINCEDPPMSIEGFCQNLPENLFDIQVLGPQNNLLDEFVGPEDGRTFDNLQPGTYTVEEIKHETFDNQLGPSQGAEDLCKERGFTDGGRLDNQNANLIYFICFEYNDEQGNDCNTITLAAGEQRTCIIKNYIQDIERI
jgi:hypothetical protein